jgi:hypothetical protein
MILNQIKNKTKNQIALDQLTGKTAIQLRASLITLEESRDRLKIAHAAMIAGCVYLPSCPSLKHAYELQTKVEETIQKIAVENWELQKTHWLIESPLTSIKTKLPDLEEVLTKREWIMKIESSNLKSASKTWKTERPGSNAWKIAWIE